MNNKRLIEAGALRQYISNSGDGPYIAAWDLEITNRVVAHLEAQLLAAQPAEGSAQVASDGWKWLPVTPTREMLVAASRVDLSYMPGQESADREAIYRAMVAATPERSGTPALDNKQARWLEIGQAVERACEVLPEGCDLHIELEHHAGDVRLYLPDTDASLDDFEADTFGGKINAAIDYALNGDNQGAEGEKA